VLSIPAPTAGVPTGIISDPLLPTAGKGDPIRASDWIKDIIGKNVVDVPVPTARHTNVVWRNQGTVVFATIFRFNASESNTTVVPADPIQMSNRAVPGVVTAHDILPDIVIFIALPM
jgi:hypothetical protein